MTSDYETKHESTKIQSLTSQLKSQKKLELETLRHNNIMEELKFMAKHKISVFQRDDRKADK